MKAESLLGILGGMGPEATVHFFEKIVETTEANTDQDHIPVIVYSDPRVPDRTLAFLGKGKSPLEDLLKGIKKLEESGASLIAIPCNSAHLWLKEMRESTRVEILNMVDIAVEKFGRHDRVGLIATTLTVESRLYESPLVARGVEVLLPEDQESVMEHIRLIKGGEKEKAREYLLGVADELIDSGATHILAGCTEVPLVLKKHDLRVPFVDPMEDMAAVCVTRMGASVRHDSLTKRRK